MGLPTWARRFGFSNIRDCPTVPHRYGYSDPFTYTHYYSALTITPRPMELTLAPIITPASISVKVEHALGLHYYILLG